MKLIRFVGRGKKNKKGERRTMQQFADTLGVHRDTLYDWLALPGFKMSIVEYSISQHAHDIPALVSGQMAVAKGQKYYGQTKDGKVIELTPNTPAFNAVMKLMGATDKVESEVIADIKGEHTVTHQFSAMTDQQLQAIIQGKE